MKKKVKLITTFASLGLALALMVFGVYAAAQGNLGITSNVTFEAQNVNYSAKYGKMEAAATWAEPTAETVIAIENNNGTATITFTDELTEAKPVAGYVIAITNGYAANQTINVAWTKPAETGIGYAVTTSGATTIAANTTEKYVVYVTVDPANVVDATVVTLDCSFVLTLAE